MSILFEMVMPSDQLARFRQWRRRRELAAPDRAGTHARREIRAVLSEWLGRAWRYLFGLLVLTAAGALLSYFIVPDALAPYVVGAIVASGAWIGYVLWLDSSGIANLRAGIGGEEFTISELRPLLRRGWRLVNHVMLEHRDVDHVLVGPGGYFAIETKYRSRWNQVPDEQKTAWARQAARSARDLYLRTDQLERVTPIVAMWGPRVADAAPAPTERNGVTLCAGKDLVSVLTTGPMILDEHSIDSVYDAIDSYVRNRTIGEERRHGPKPRAIADHTLDLLVGVFAASLSLIAVAFSARIEPSLLSYPLGCVALLTSAVFARRRWRHPRIRAISVGMIASAMFMLGVAIVAVLVAFVAS